MQPLFISGKVFASCCGFALHASKPQEAPEWQLIMNDLDELRVNVLWPIYLHTSIWRMNTTKHEWNLDSVPQVVLGITINKHCGNHMWASPHVTSYCFCER